MLDRGEIDAAYGFAPRHDPKLFKLNIDRYGGTPLEGNPRLEKLFADGGRSVIEAFFKKTGMGLRQLVNGTGALTFRQTSWPRRN